MTTVLCTLALIVSIAADGTNTIDVKQMLGTLQNSRYETWVVDFGASFEQQGVNRVLNNSVQHLPNNMCNIVPPL